MFLIRSVPSPGDQRRPSPGIPPYVTQAASTDVPVSFSEIKVWWNINLDINLDWEFLACNPQGGPETIKPRLRFRAANGTLLLDKTYTIVIPACSATESIVIQHEIAGCEEITINDETGFPKIRVTSGNFSIEGNPQE